MLAYWSMMVIIGAISADAEAAEAASAPRRNPKFLVFQICAASAVRISSLIFGTAIVALCNNPDGGC